MEDPDDRRQTWLDWAATRYPGRDDIAAVVAQAALHTQSLGGTEDEAEAAARREVRKQFPKEAATLAMTIPSPRPAPQPVSVSAGEAFKIGIFAGIGFLLLLAVVQVFLSMAGITFITFGHP